MLAEELDYVVGVDTHRDEHTLPQPLLRGVLGRDRVRIDQPAHSVRIITLPPRVAHLRVL